MKELYKDHVKGELGQYCPILMTQSELDPVVDHGGHICPACYSWQLAQRQAGKVIQKPKLNRETMKAEPIQNVDFLLSNSRILAVEDNIVSMKILEKTMGGLSNAFIKAKNGEEALAAVNQGGAIKLVLLDLSMPVMDGYTFMQKLSEIYREDLPFAVVLVSELKNWEQAKSLIGNGVLSWVKKPYSAVELIEAIQFALFSFQENQKVP